MKEQLIEFQTAVLAKEKGFKFDVEYFDSEEDMVLYSGYHQFVITPHNQHLGKDIYDSLPLHWLEFNHGGHECINNIDQPTQNLLQKWLREVHNCHVEVEYHTPENGDDATKENIRYNVEVNCYGKDFDIPFTENADFFEYDFNTYEEALEVGLKFALQLIK